MREIRDGSTMPKAQLDTSSSQLDDILNELLNDRSSSSVEPKSWSNDAQQTGSLTTQSGNSRTIISWQTSQAAGPSKKTLTVSKQIAGSPRWDSEPEDQTTKARSVWKWDQTADGIRTSSSKAYQYRTDQKRSETLKSEQVSEISPVFLQNDGSSTLGRPGKTPPPPPVRKRLISADELGIGTGGTNQNSLRRREELAAGRKEWRNCASDSEDTKTWLDEQMWKLQAKRNGKSYQQHSVLEKRLISDLKSHLSTKYGQSDTEEGHVTSPLLPQSGEPSPPRKNQRAINGGSYDDVAAGRTYREERTIFSDKYNTTRSDTEDSLFASPKERTTSDLREKENALAVFSRSFDDVKTEVSSSSATPQYGGRDQGTTKRQPPVRSMSLGDDRPIFKTKATFFVSGIERPAFSTHQTKYTFSVSPLKCDDSANNKSKPPPVPPRSSTPTSPVTPKRGDSLKEALIRSQRQKLVCSPTLDELENTLRLILEQPNQPPSAGKVAEPKRIATPVKDIDEIIELKPIGPGVHTLEPDNTGTLKRPFTPLLPVSTINSESAILVASDNANVQHGQTTKQQDQANQRSGQVSQPGHVSVQYSTEAIQRSQPVPTVTNVMMPAGSVEQMPVSGQQPQLWLQQQQPPVQQQQLIWQQQQSLQQQPQFPIQQQLWLQQPLRQPLQQEQPWQQQQNNSWLQQQQQQQTWHQQQAWQQQQPQFQQQQFDTLSRVQPKPFSQMMAPAQTTVQTSEIYQQRAVQNPVTTYNADTLTRSTQPGFSGQQNDLAYDTLPANRMATLQQNQQFSSQNNMQQFGTQQRNAQQMNGQQMNGQQMNGQQMNGLQMNGLQMNAQGNAQNYGQQMNSQQSNAQLMTAYESPVQYGAQKNLQSNIVQQVVQPIGFQQETVKYTRVERIPPQNTIQQNVTGAQTGVHFTSQPGSVSLQNQGQQVQQQQQQQQQQHVQQQMQSGTFHSAMVEQQASGSSVQNGTQVFGVGGGGGGGGGGGTMGRSFTLDSRTVSPALFSGPMSAGSWPSGYGGTLQRSQTLHAKKTDMSASHDTLLRRAASPSSTYHGQSRNGSLVSISDGLEYTNTMPRFVRDTSKFWHKPNISREEAINLLKDQPPGSFVIRNSSTFQGGYGLALKVAQLPPNVQAKGDDLQANLVRHFLIESNSKGVRLKGCSNEPVFGSLAALVYQHSITPLALPCKLLLPVSDISGTDELDRTSSESTLLPQEPALNALYLDSVETESLTGPEALSKAIDAIFGMGSVTLPKPTNVQFKVSHQGITLTDNKHSVFFRRHYPLNTVTFCGTDGKDRRWTLTTQDNGTVSGKLFGFVARKSGVSNDNACHLFFDPDTSQTGSNIVGLVTKAMMGQGQFMKT